MRTLIAGLCLVAVGFVLEGCGGGGSSTCVNSQVDLVSQSLTGKVTGSASTNIMNISQNQDINGDVLYEKMDFEKFNYASSISMPVTTKLPDGTALDMKVESKSVFMASQKMMVSWTRITDNKKGTSTTNCTKKMLDSLPSAAALAADFQMVKSIMQAKATCAGNDGTDDTWKVAQTYDGPIPAIPGLPVKVPPGATADVKFDLSLKMDKDLLIHGGVMNVDVSGSAPGMTMHVVENSDLTISDAKAGGPTDKDLDVSDWGDCTPAPAADEEMLFQPASVHEDADTALASMKKSMVFQSHILATIQATLKSQHKPTVIV